MGWLSSARRKVKDLGRRTLASAGRKTARAFRYMQNPVENVQTAVINRALGSSYAEDAQNSVLRAVFGETLLMVVVSLASCIMYKEEPSWEADWNLALGRRAFNYVMPCVISALATETCRDVVVNWCDQHTRPVAKRLQRWIARNWYKRSARMAVEYGAGTVLGSIIMALSITNDPWATFVLITQTMLTKIAVGLIKNPDHPLKVCCRRRCRDYRELPDVTTIDDDFSPYIKEDHFTGQTHQTHHTPLSKATPAAPDDWTEMDTAPHLARYELRKQIKAAQKKRRRGR